ncbi:MAG: hypothetical protein JWR18_4231, partial [Segetibacter sp.]|nr:hypothetical protein [Segetibacter sp.]
DGDSLSVKEAIYLGLNVIATNVVDRPEGVFLVENNKEIIKNSIQHFIPQKNSYQPLEDGAKLLYDLYKEKVR